MNAIKRARSACSWTVSKAKSFLLSVKHNFWELFVFTVPNWLFFLVACALLLYYFNNLDNDTTNISNIGFALLAGISTIIFTWARSLENEDDKLLKAHITHLAEQALHAALLFLVASGLKYVALEAGHLNEPEPFALLEPKLLKGVMNYAATVTFTLAEFKAGRVIFRVNKILRVRLDKDSLM